MVLNQHRGQLLAIVLYAVFVGNCLEPAVGQDPDDDRQKVRSSRAQAYVDGMFKKYDLDGDGILDRKEQEKLRRKPKGADSDRDGKISKEELLATLLPALASSESRRSGIAERQNDRTVARRGETGETEMDRIRQRFVKAMLTDLDVNGNGQLDSDEIANAKWSSPDWRQSDTNGNGALDEKELEVRFEKIFGDIMGRTQTVRSKSVPQQGQSRSASGGFIGGGLTGDLVGRPAQQSRRPTSKQQQDRRGQLITGLMGGGGGGMMGAMMGSMPSDASTRKSAASRVEINLYLLRIPQNDQSESNVNSVQAIEQASPRQLANTISRLSRDNNGSFDHVQFTGVNKAETQITSASQVNVRTGVTQSRGGARSSVYEAREVGLRVEVKPTVYQDHVSLQVELSKNDVVNDEDAKDEFANSKTIVWEYSSNVRVKPGQAGVASVLSGGQNWILVATAEESE